MKPLGIITKKQFTEGHLASSLIYPLNMRVRLLFFFFALVLVCPQRDAFLGCGDDKLTQDLDDAASRAAIWLSENLIDETTETEGHILAAAFHSLRLVGHPLEVLSHHETSSMNNDHNVEDVGKVALYAQGFISVCQDPKRRFLKRLQDGIKQCKKSDFTHPFQYMTAVLALCNSGRSFVPRRTHIILKKLSSWESEYQSIDSVAMATIALSCVKKRQEEVWGEKEKHRWKLVLKKRNMRKTIHSINRGTKWLLKKQNDDGSFGENGITTALATQAILSNKNWSKIKWQCSKTMKYLLNQQREDGSFGDLMSTIQILPVLKGAVPHDLKGMKCAGNQSDTKNIKINSRKIKSVKENVTAEEKPLIDVCLIINFNETSQRRFNVQVKSGSTVHEILKIATKLSTGSATDTSDRFSFTASKTKYGAMVESICGVEEEKEKRLHWIMYTSPITMATVGVDGFRPMNGTCVIFKLKKTGDESLPCKN